jgi:hypothetical protein
MTPSELQDWALRQIGSVTTGKSGEIKGFLETVCLWLADWCAEKSLRSKTKTGYCALVLDPDVVAVAQGAKFNLKVFFKEDYSPQLGGNLYVTDYALNRVHCHSAHCSDLDEVARLIKKQGLSTRPTVVFDTDSQTLFIFETGIEGNPVKFQLRVPLPQKFGYSHFAQILDRIYKGSLRYPETLPAIWNNPSTHVPGREVERTIQGHVCEILKYHTQGHNYLGGTPVVVRERQTNVGIADVVVLVGASCIVAAEMKVLRQRHFSDKKSKNTSVSAAFNEWWASRGAKQAAQYKDVEDAKDGVLLLYDMRSKDDDFASVVALCTSLAVHYKRYYLYNKGPNPKKS